VIRDAGSRRIVYMPPEASDVPRLLEELLDWLRRNEREGVPCPIRAGIAHYQFATIHPYYDGNGRTARLLTILILHRGGYDLKGLYSPEEYYARDLSAYDQALAVGPSHNDYQGRVAADITAWVEYFCAGMADRFDSVRRRAQEAADRGMRDDSAAMRRLDPRQRRALELFRRSVVIISREVEALFGVSQRTARNILSSWVSGGFVLVVDPARKSRRYRLSSEYEGLGPS
jgi:Fic family protein